MNQGDLDDEIIRVEQEIVNESNKELLFKNEEKSKYIELFKYVLDLAWERNSDISPDEKNLIEKLKKKMNITDHEYQLLETKIGKFPKDQNQIHTRGEIKSCRQELQKQGLLLCFRDANKNDYDVIPEETVQSLRKFWGIEMRTHGYRELLSNKRVRSKKYFTDILSKAEIPVESNPSLDDLKELLVEHVKPTQLLGGFSPRDGLDLNSLSDWCKELSLSTSGQKNDLIARIIEYYDQIKAIAFNKDGEADQRELYFTFFEQIAERKYDELRQQQVITKDKECDLGFEAATYYIFEKLLSHKPLQLSGTDHPDGILAYKNKLILWDNKSKETKVNLKDHIKQFDRYIKESTKDIAAFIVIAPDFTEESVKDAMKYKLNNDVIISLLRAKDLKDIAKQYAKNKNEEPFPLGNLIQTGIVDKEKVIF